jgi:hypothetical protein
LPAWLCGLCELAPVGVEGTGCYGVRLTRYLVEQHVTVIEA